MVEAKIESLSLAASPDPACPMAAAGDVGALWFAPGTGVGCVDDGGAVGSAGMLGCWWRICLC